ncbi:MAG: M48 family metalloprotease [Sphingomonadaceae bacterium]|nr:M48 family metalloprotease [Sphingomonadaceae bacterium]
MVSLIARPQGQVARMLRGALVALLALVLAAQPALAQQQSISFLRDAETEALLNDLSRPLIEAAGLSPENVEIVLVNDRSMNAFVAGGQRVYLHSGLLIAAENANEVQGVIAHELGHVTGGHAVSHPGMGSAGGISILSLLLGAAAMAAGAGEAGVAILSAGSRAAIGSFLAYNRIQENAADQAGATYLRQSGISGRGSLAFFRRIQNQEYRLAIPQDEGSYDRTHPLSGERLAILETQYQRDPAWEAPTDPALEARFQRVRAKLIGYVSEPNATLQSYPESDTSVPARYARAYAWHKRAFMDRALAEVNSLLQGAPDDPYFLELQGQIYLESGRPDDAIEPLRRATANSRSNPLIASMFGHALIATEDAANYAEAQRVLRTAVQRDNRNPFAWIQLGTVYAHEGDESRVALAMAENFNLQGQAGAALTSARAAMAGIPQGTPDWLRAQDIAMVSEEAMRRARDND